MALKVVAKTARTLVEESHQTKKHMNSVRPLFLQMEPAKDVRLVNDTSLFQISIKDWGGWASRLTVKGVRKKNEILTTLGMEFSSSTN